MDIGAKRPCVRTLASRLWDSDDDSVIITSCAHCSQNLRQAELEMTRLSNIVQQIHAEKKVLQERMIILKEKLATVNLQLFDVQKFVIPLGGKPHGSKNTSNSWLENIGDVKDEPRMDQFLKQWRNCNFKHEIQFVLCPQPEMTASKILDHCEWAVHSLGKKHPVVYKIGITENCIDRWASKDYSYKHDPYEAWEGMLILFVAANSLSCAFVESFLIHRFRGRRGNRNVNPGGETAKPGRGPFFTYCVYRILRPPATATS